LVHETLDLRHHRQAHFRKGESSSYRIPHRPSGGSSTPTVRAGQKVAWADPHLTTIDRLKAVQDGYCTLAPHPGQGHLLFFLVEPRYQGYICQANHKSDPAGQLEHADHRGVVRSCSRTSRPSRCVSTASSSCYRETKQPMADGLFACRRVFPDAPPVTSRLTNVPDISVTSNCRYQCSTRSS
jgi:hypothetical protein